MALILTEPKKYHFQRTIHGRLCSVLLKGWFKKKVKIFTIKPGIIKAQLRFYDDSHEFIDILERKRGRWVLGKYPITNDQQSELTKLFLETFPELKDCL